jgi:hypothetical protein
MRQPHPPDRRADPVFIDAGAWWGTFAAARIVVKERARGRQVCFVFLPFLTVAPERQGKPSSGFTQTTPATSLRRCALLYSAGGISRGRVVRSAFSACLTDLSAHAASAEAATPERLFCILAFSYKKGSRRAVQARPEPHAEGQDDAVPEPPPLAPVEGGEIVLSLRHVFQTHRGGAGAGAVEAGAIPGANCFAFPGFLTQKAQVKRRR